MGIHSKSTDNFVAGISGKSKAGATQEMLKLVKGYRLASHPG